MMMNREHLLQQGKTIRGDEAWPNCRIEQFVGSDGLGETYSAHLGELPVEVKWYFESAATPEQRTGLELMVRMGCPDPHFQWPISLAWAPGLDGFGYIMPARETRYRDMATVMDRTIDATFHGLVTACIGLAHAFLKLHTHGLSHRDISLWNVSSTPAPVTG